MALKSLSGLESESEAAIMAEINITPLTDIFLVLLIIFMVTSSVMSQMGVDVSLPQASQATSQSQPDGIIVSLLPGGKIRVNDQLIKGQDPKATAPVPKQLYEELESVLKKEFSKTTSRLIILEGDKQSFLGSAIEVMDHARKAGAEKFAIATALDDSK